MSEGKGIRIQAHDGASAEVPAKGMLVVGSDASRADFVVTAQGVDDAHCAIGRVKDGGFAIKDLGSQYGTFVNGAKVATARVSVGDVVVLGSASIHLVDPSAAIATPSAAILEELPRTPRRAPPTARPASTVAPGATIGGFRIERVLGRGGMGEVLLAVQESLHRNVALKILSPTAAADAEFVRAFHSEARAAAALSHPNVVVVFDVGEDEGRHYLAMEYMPGGSLEDRIARDGLIPWRETLDILHHAANGLTYAESQGIVHRDIKPANLMVAESGAIKIADLGLATQVAEQGDGAQAEGRKVYGTPHFIAPEQARGLAVDHRSDLYALGATAYRLMTGRTPFEGPTARDIVRARFQEDPVRLRRHVPGIPADVDDLVLKLMAREPADRFQSARELLREIDRLRLQADHGAPAAPIAVAQPAPSKTPLAIGVLVALGIAGGAAWYVLVGSGGGQGGSGDGAKIANAGSSGTSTPAAPGDTNRDSGSNTLDDSEFFGDGKTEPTEIDEEARLKVLELEAKLAYSQIPSSYAPQERIDALEEIVRDYGPTSVANDIRKEITDLRNSLVQAKVTDARRERDQEDALDRIRRAAGWPPEGPPLLRADQVVDRMRAYGVSTALVTNPEFQVRRKALEDEVVAAVDAAVRAELDRVDRLATDGEFAQVRASLEKLDLALSIPPQDGDEPRGYAGLRLLHDRVRNRRSKVDAEEQAFVAATRSADQRALGAAVGPSSGLIDSLEKLDLATAVQRIDAVVETVQTSAAREAGAGLVARLRAANGALSMLVESFAKGGWRRKTVAVPSGRRTDSGETVGAQEDGLLVAFDGGAELVPWARFMESTIGLSALFKSRLERSYTPEEDAAIIELLTIDAVVRSVDVSYDSLDPSKRSLFRPSDGDKIREAFVAGREWVKETSSSPAVKAAAETLERERTAALLLADALDTSQNGAWTQTVATIEYLLRDYGDTLVVALLSNGTRGELLAEPAAEIPSPEEAVDGAASEGDDSSPGADEGGAESGGD